MNKKIYTIMKGGHPYTRSEERWRDNTHDDGALISEIPEEGRQMALNLLSSWFEKSSRTSNRHNSYGIKHWLEEATRYYVSNNQLKDAMLSLGFETSNFNDLNWYFKVKPTLALKDYLKSIGRDW